MGLNFVFWNLFTLMDGLYEFHIYLLHCINNFWVGSLFTKTGIKMIIKFYVFLEFFLIYKTTKVSEAEEK